MILHGKVSFLSVCQPLDKYYIISLIQLYSNDLKSLLRIEVYEYALKKQSVSLYIIDFTKSTLRIYASLILFFVISRAK